MSFAEFFKKVAQKLFGPTDVLSEIQVRVEMIKSSDEVFSPGQAEMFYQYCYDFLQNWGMSMTNGEESHDEAVWEDANRHLVAVREVLNEEFHADLPEFVVRSLVEEMMREGFLEVPESFKGERPRNVRVRIVAVPSGGAPEIVRQEWIGIEFPARYIPGLHPVRDFVSHKLKSVNGVYMVPGHVAVEALSKKSLEAARWFVEHTSIFSEYMFDASCAQVISDS